MIRSVWRTRVKGIGLVLCLMMLALWVFSVLFESFYVPPSRQWSITIAYGRYVFNDSRAGLVPVSPWKGVFSSTTGWRCSPSYPEWKVAAAQIPWAEFAHRYLGFGLPCKGWGIPRELYVPVWLLVVAVGFPTTILWWRDRRPKAGFCKVCKYNLTGNVSGICPECGTAMEKATKTNNATTSTYGA